MRRTRATTTRTTPGVVLPLELQLEILKHAAWSCKPLQPPKFEPTEEGDPDPFPITYPVTASWLQHPFVAAQPAWADVDGSDALQALEFAAYVLVSGEWAGCLHSMSSEVLVIDAALDPRQFAQLDSERGSKAVLLHLPEPPKAAREHGRPARVNEREFRRRQQSYLELQLSSISPIGLLKKTRAAIVGAGMYVPLKALLDRAAPSGSYERMRELRFHLPGDPASWRPGELDVDSYVGLVELLDKCTNLETVEIVQKVTDWSTTLEFPDGTALFGALNKLLQLKTLYLMDLTFATDEVPSGVYALKWDKHSLTTLVLDGVDALAGLDGIMWLMSQFERTLQHAEVSIANPQFAFLVDPPLPSSTQNDATWKELRHLAIYGLGDGPVYLLSPALRQLLVVAPVLAEVHLADLRWSADVEAVFTGLAGQAQLPLKKVVCRFELDGLKNYESMQETGDALRRRGVAAQFSHRDKAKDRVLRSAFELVV